MKVPDLVTKLKEVLNAEPGVFELNPETLKYILKKVARNDKEKGLSLK